MRLGYGILEDSKQLVPTVFFSQSTCIENVSNRNMVSLREASTYYRHNAFMCPETTKAYYEALILVHMPTQVSLAFTKAYVEQILAHATVR